MIITLKVTEMFVGFFSSNNLFALASVSFYRLSLLIPKGDKELGFGVMWVFLTLLYPSIILCLEHAF